LLLAIGAISVSGSKVQIAACSRSLIVENGVINVIYCQKPNKKEEAAAFFVAVHSTAGRKKKCK